MEIKLLPLILAISLVAGPNAKEKLPPRDGKLSLSRGEAKDTTGADTFVTIDLEDLRRPSAPARPVKCVPISKVMKIDTPTSRGIFRVLGESALVSGLASIDYSIVLFAQKNLAKTIQYYTDVRNKKPMIRYAKILAEAGVGMGLVALDKYLEKNEQKFRTGLGPAFLVAAMRNVNRELGMMSLGHGHTKIRKAARILAEYGLIPLSSHLDLGEAVSTFASHDVAITAKEYVEPVAKKLPWWVKLPGYAGLSAGGVFLNKVLEHATGLDFGVAQVPALMGFEELRDTLGSNLAEGSKHDLWRDVSSSGNANAMQGVQLEVVAVQD